MKMPWSISHHKRIKDKPSMKNEKKEKRILFDHKRIREKPSMKNKPNPLKDPEYLSYVHDVIKPRCFVCGRPYMSEEENGINYTALHHIKLASSDVKDDHKVLPLCNNTCHLFGKLSPHGTPVLWRETFPLAVQEAAAGKIHQIYKDAHDFE